jgi:hypothetical protein
MVTSFPNCAEYCPGTLSLSRVGSLRDMPESLWSGPRGYPDPVGNSTLALIGISLDLLGQFLDLFGFLNNIEREDIGVHLVQLIPELVG